ncbi:MAG: redoxin family protein [Ignavibacteria bacterium]|nr:redoxin family protein [Ignavibacteria bacterium]
MVRILLVVLIVVVGAHCLSAQQNDQISTGILPVISGRVRSTTEGALSDLTVYITEPRSLARYISAVVDRDGNFRFEPDARIRAGVYKLAFASPDHKMLVHDIFLTPETRGVKIVVTLETNRKRGEVIDSVKIISDFSDGNFDNAPRMSQRPDGTYAADIALKGGTAVYQVIPYITGIPADDNHSVNGTMQSSYEYDDGGDYRSIIKGKGKKITVVWNPAAAATSDKPADFVYLSPDDIRIDSARESFNKRSFDAFRGLPPNITDPIEIRRWRNGREGDAAFELAKALELPEGRLRDVAIANSCIRYIPLVLSFRDETSYAERIASSVPPDAYAWTVSDEALVPIIATAPALPTLWEYLDSVVSAHPDRGADVLYRSMLVASLAGDSAQIKRLYDRFMSAYPKHDMASSVKRKFNPNSFIKPGNQLPSFDFTLLGDPNTHVTPSSLRGKYVLIDLWATWCAPCVAEMPNIERVWKLYGGSKLEIVSISLDASEKDIAPFREKRFPMAWKHVYSPGLFNSKAAELFEVSGIPKPILVGPDGRIIAVSEGLRGEELEKTLGVYLER